MSASIVIRCEFKGCRLHLDSVAPTYDKAREVAWGNLGWGVVLDRDLCPAHVEIIHDFMRTGQGPAVDTIVNYDPERGEDHIIVAEKCGERRHSISCPTMDRPSMPAIPGARCTCTPGHPIDCGFCIGGLVARCRRCQARIGYEHSAGCPSGVDFGNRHRVQAKQCGPP